MISLARLLLPLGLVALSFGCASTTVTKEGKALTLLRPKNQNLERGETNKVLITIQRDGFSGPVEIELQDLPSGVRVVEKAVVPAGDTFQSFTLFAEADAEPVAHHTVTIVAKGPDGLAAEERFQIDIS